MHHSARLTTATAAVVALGGFLMGFDASVISGVVGFIETEFRLTKFQLGWSVASLTLTATLAMLLAGPLSDRFGRRPLLQAAAALFTVSAVASALAPGYASLVAARMIGGLGVGAALIVAPMYIAEIAPAESRGRLVSFNQLNIVIGISAAFFSNYLILNLGQSDLPAAASLRLDDWNWRWMLGVEALPAVVYLLALAWVPESPRWLAMHDRAAEALRAFTRFGGADRAEAALARVRAGLDETGVVQAASMRALFRPSMRLVMTVGITIAVLQQITGINAVFFYAPLVFEQSGVGTDAAFMQAVLVGLVNLSFTIVAMLCIDKLGRRPLLGAGLAGMAVCMLVLSYGFSVATEVNATLVLLAILGFVASFAVSLGPVMWVLFSELFPNRLRATAVSVAGLVNSAVSFGVQLLFPWQLENLGNSFTFLVYGLFALLGFVFVVTRVPETRGRSLEELEGLLIGD